MAGVLIVGVACGDADVTDPTLPAVDSAVVFMPAFSFSPFTTAIRIGGKVVFDFPSERHNVIFARVQGAPADIQVTRNVQVPRTFTAAGDFSYDCTLHPGMSGVVVVTP